jgi:acyl transferase domain-containing protein
VPLERWDVDGFAKVSPNALEARFGSFISGAQLFDAAAFSISRPEALYMDPQQRLLLQHAAEALWARVGASPQAAGFKAGGGVSERTGVMIGIGPAEYVNQTSELLPMGMYFATGGAISVAAGRWVGGWVAGWLGAC